MFNAWLDLMIPTLYKSRHGARSSRNETWSKLFCRSVKVVDFIFLGTITFNYDYILYCKERNTLNTNTCNLFLDDYDNSDDPNRNINSKLSRQTIILEFALTYESEFICVVKGNNYIMFIDNAYHESVSRIKRDYDLFYGDWYLFNKHIVVKIQQHVTYK